MQSPGAIPNGAATGLLNQDEERFASGSLNPGEHAGVQVAMGSRIASRPEWQLAVRVAASRPLAKSDLLQRFLLGVCEMTLEGRSDEITEYRIGTTIFQRPATYNPGEDNIVRSYARMLRRRLDSYFGNEGASEPLRIVIPRGGYVPVFEPAHGARTSSAAVPGDDPRRPASDDVPDSQTVPPLSTTDRRAVGGDSSSKIEESTWWRWALFGSGLGAGSLIAVMLLFLVPTRWRPAAPGSELTAAHALWAQIFTPERNTLIVPADAGLGIYQNVTGHEITLAEYANGAYISAGASDGGIKAGSLNDLRRQRYTSVACLDIVTRLVRLPEYVPNRTQVRFARNITAEDLKSENVVLLGSSHSNPWVQLFEPRVNFRFQYGPAVDQSAILNVHPEAGELARYSNDAADTTGRTFGAIDWLPSLDGQGHVLIIQGLNMAATQAAAELLFNPAQIGPILEEARLSNGAIRPFELVIETSSIGAASPAARVIATRMYAP